MTSAQVHFPSRALPVEFAVWPARTLYISQFLVLAEERLPGLPQWIQTLRKTVSPSLLEDLLLLNALNVVKKVVDEQLLAGLSGQSVPAFLEWIAGFDFERLISLVKNVELEPVKGPDGNSRPGISLRMDDSTAEWAREPLPDRARQRLHQIASNPEALRSHLIATLSCFWAEHLRSEFDHLAPSLAAAVKKGQERFVQPQTLEDLVEGLVGRRKAVTADELQEGACRILATPVIHLGPYAMSSRVDLADPVVVLEFEASRFLRHSQRPHATLTASVFRALGDDSRLRIVHFLQTGEHFGGEIVLHTELSQATVSGHLRFLVAENIVLVRREGNTKYYSLNADFFSKLGNSISDFTASR